MNLRLPLPLREGVGGSGPWEVGNAPFSHPLLQGEGE